MMSHLTLFCNVSVSDIICVFIMHQSLRPRMPISTIRG